MVGAAFFLFVAIRFFSISAENQSAGFEFGKKHDAHACVDEAVRRHTDTIDPTRQLGESAFVQTCLMRAKPNAEFCRDVPELNILNQAPAVAWAESKCREKASPDGGCHYIYLAVITHCKMREETRPRAKTSQ